MDIGEDELVATIRRVLSGAGPEVVVGVGDDAAVLAPPAGEQVLTTDAMIEGTHFEIGTTSARDLGAKVIAVNLSDIAAMAASPRAAVCALGLSGAVDAAWVVELFGGMRELCDEHALWLVGGNLAAAREVSVTVTVLGEVAPGRAVRRSGARPGDRVAVTGALGAAAAGLRVTRTVKHPTAAQRELIRALQRPVPRVGEAAVLARHGATAMIDISDGLVRDLLHVCAASDAGVRLERHAVPVAPGADVDEAFGGGEDYELLVTMPGDEEVAAAARELDGTFGVPLTAIGVMTDAAAVLVDADGVEQVLEDRGWEHFR